MQMRHNYAFRSSNQAIKTGSSVTMTCLKNLDIYLPARSHLISADATESRAREVLNFKKRILLFQIY